MGMTHGETDTYPRTADVMGFCAPKDALAVAEAVVTVQRDWGDRTNRKHARLKYTIEDRGLDAFRAEVEKRIGKALEPAAALRVFDSNGDRYGWTAGEDGRFHLTLFIENGRLRDIPDGPALLTGMRRIAEVHEGEFRLTANQNVIVANVRAGESRGDRGARRRARADEPRRRAAAQRHGLRRAADLRPRARRERALPADPRHGARGAARAAWARATTRSRSA